MVELFTVTETYQNKQGTVLLPGFSLADKRPEVQKLIQGCMLVLVQPDGRMKFPKLVTYGIPVTRVDNYIQMSVNPALEPEKVFVQLTIDSTEEVPIGTRVLSQ